MFVIKSVLSGGKYLVIFTFEAWGNFLQILLNQLIISSLKHGKTDKDQ
jgi:hypothetical protein